MHQSSPNWVCRWR